MKMMTVTMPDGSVWGVPVELIALNRAKAYADEFDGDVERSLAEDTLPYFEEDAEYNIIDWAANQMNWCNFDGHQVKISDAPPPDFDEAWCSGEKGITEFTKTD
jgi:hypothetical protein